MDNFMMKDIKVNCLTFYPSYKQEFIDKVISIIPEVRIDRGITPLFSTKTGTATNASTFIVAAIYAF